MLNLNVTLNGQIIRPNVYLLLYAKLISHVNIWNTTQSIYFDSDRKRMQDSANLLSTNYQDYT
jgi:hypothetical protein